MANERTITVPRKFKALAGLAHLLERLEHAPGGVDAGQYRTVVQRVQHELQTLQGEAELPRLLAWFPAAAELYENLRYEQAGLCLHRIEESLATETAASAAIRQAARRAP